MTAITMDAMAYAAPMRATRSSAAINGCAAVIWAKDVAGAHLKHDILGALNDHIGVTEVRFSRTRLNFVIVHYDHQKTKAKEILDVVRQYGLDAKLVGC